MLIVVNFLIEIELYTLAKNGQDHATVNNYAKWIRLKLETLIYLNTFLLLVLYLMKYLLIEKFKTEVGEFTYNMWFNGQTKKLNSYNKEKRSYYGYY
jgi:hypothetical protein